MPRTASRNLRDLLAAPLCALALAACGGGSTSDGQQMANFTLSLTDAPIDSVDEVHVVFNGVTLKPRGGEALEFLFADRDVDLLALQGGVTEDLITNERVPADAYNWIELHVVPEASFAVPETGGMEDVDLLVPSGRLRLVSGFVVTAGQNNQIVLDWNMRKGLSDPVGQVDTWILTPAVRVIDMTAYGSLSGTVADTLIEDASCTSEPDTGAGNLVYVFDGFDVTPDDMGSATEPLTTAPVATDDTMAGAYRFSVPFLDAPDPDDPDNMETGEYTVAFTCQGLNDADPNADDDVAFLATANATVVNGADTEVIFE